MYGDGYSGTTSQNESHPASDKFETIKDISDIKPRHRRLNDYTTIPRKSRSSHGQLHEKHSDDDGEKSQTHYKANYQTTELYRAKPEYAKQSTGGISEQLKTSIEDKLSISSNETQEKAPRAQHRKHKSWSIRKLRNVLKRSKSLKDSERKSEDSLNSASTHSINTSGLLFTSLETPGSPTKVIDPVEAGWYRKPPSPENVKRDSRHSDSVKRGSEDIYDDIDNLRLAASPSHKDLSDCSSCRSMNSGSSMSLHSGYNKPGSHPDSSKSSQKSSVMKALSSMTIRNLGMKKSTKKPKESDYDSTEFRRDQCRSSFHDNSAVGKRLSNNDCRRCRSFTTVSPEKVTHRTPIPTRRDAEIYSKQTEYETRDCETLYSLAKADDLPPPLPERTYLKMREGTLKENTKPSDKLYKITPGYEHRASSLPLQETNNNYKSTTYNATTTSLHEKPHHQPLTPLYRRRRRPDSGNSSAKPFMLHQYLMEADRHTLSSGVSSGYGSVASEVEVEYPRVPPPRPPSICTLPRRSRHLTSEAPRTFRGTSGDADLESQPSDTQRSDEDDHGVHRLTSNVIHNSPVPPGPGGAQLVRTIKLDSILKNKWISGIAITKKNEYIVLDQREAYLLDEEGSLKKTIGAKNSGKLTEPFNVCVCPANGNLIICDHAEQDIKIYSWKGQFIKKVKDSSLTNIAGVAVTENKEIVVAGTDKQRISILTDDGYVSYTIPNDIDSLKSKSRLPFEHPYSVAVNPLTGDIIIGDDYKHMVTAVAPGRHDQPTRVLWRYSPGPGDRHFFPSSICVDSTGYIFIADLYNEKVYMLDSGGKFVKTLLSRGDGLRGGPGAIATDNRGYILVADEEKTIKVFRYKDENGFAVTKRVVDCP